MIILRNISVLQVARLMVQESSQFVDPAFSGDAIVKKIFINPLSAQINQEYIPRLLLKKCII